MTNAASPFSLRYRLITILIHDFIKLLKFIHFMQNYTQIKNSTRQVKRYYSYTKYVDNIKYTTIKETNFFR